MKTKWKKLCLTAIMISMLEFMIFSHLAAVPVRAQTVTPELLITEIVPASAGTGQPYEYVEIYNNTSQPINLDGYKLQYYSNITGNPANTWPISDKIIRPRSTLVLWLKKFDYPNVPLWDFNDNYGTQLTPDQVFEVKLTTSAQGLHDTSLRKVAIADANGNVIVDALINNNEADGITNRSVIYKYTGSGTSMEKIRNNEQATPGVVLNEQIPGPLPPVNVTAQAGDGTVKLEWTHSDPAVNTYRVYHTGASQPLTVTDATYADITGLDNGTEYYFWVTAVDDNEDESPVSEPVGSVPLEVPDNDPPAAPAHLQATPKAGRVFLSWDPNAEQDLAGYRIYVNGALCCTVPASEHTVNITPLTQGKTYTFVVTAVDRAGNESPKTSQVAAGPAVNDMPELLITELIPDTDNYASYDAFEFIELYNATDKELDLLGYTIQSGSWQHTIERSIKVGPWETAVIWTRRAEISPLTLEAFNSYYYGSYKSKYLTEDRFYIVENVGGLVNSGTQTVTLYDPFKFEVVKAIYEGADVAAGKSITFRYPDIGTSSMVKIGGGQKPTPGTVTKDQVPAKPQQDTDAPLTPANVQVLAGEGSATISWTPNQEPDLFGYNLYRDGAFEYFVPASVNTFTVYGLTGNKSYQFQVSAVDTSDNESPLSQAITVTPLHQKMTQLERAVHTRDAKYQTLWDISDDGPVTPGLSEGVVPQGITYLKDRNWLITIGYLEDGRPSAVAVMDAATGKLVKSLTLYDESGNPYTGHAGGITISRKHVWVASETYVYRIPLDDLLNAADGGELHFEARVPVPMQAAFATYSDGVLWVGEFYEAKDYPTDPSHHMTNRDGDTYYAWMIGYVLDDATDMVSADSWDGDASHEAIPDYIVSIPEKVQGAVVREDSIILSTSYGRGNDSRLYRYNNPLDTPHHATADIGSSTIPVWFLDNAEEKPNLGRLTVIPMSEGLVDVGDDLYVVFESGANKYRYTTAYIMDRLLVIDLDLWDKYGTAYIGGVPATLTVGDTVQAQVLIHRGKAAPDDVTASYQFASSDPNVADVTPDGRITAVAAGSVEITATDGTDTLSLILTVNRKSSTTPPSQTPGTGSGGSEEEPQEEPEDESPAEENEGEPGIRGLDEARKREVAQSVGEVQSALHADLHILGEAFEFVPGEKPETVRIPVDSRFDGIPVGVYKVEADGTLVYVGGKRNGGVLEAQLAEAGVYVALAFDKTYDDVSPEHWYYEAVRELSAMLVVRGVDETRFAPARQVTRAEFAALLVRALGLKASQPSTFTDVDPDAWYAGVVAAAEQYGLITGRGDGTFDPNAPVTREEMAALLVRAFRIMGETADVPEIQGSFTDLDAASDWAKEAIAAAFGFGLVSGYPDGSYGPSKPVTRAEAVQAVLNLLSASN